MTFVYLYFCDKCNKYFNNGKICPKCGNKTVVKSFEKSKSPLCEDGINCGWDALYKDNPRWSWAMGVANEKEVEESIKQYPDRVYNEHFQLLICNRAHKLLEQKRHGLSER